MEIKRLVIRLALVAEVCVFAYFYVCGTGGVTTMYSLDNETSIIDGANRVLLQEVSAIEQEIIAWNEDDFYKEKIAREQLQMAYDGDDIYYLKS